MTSLADAERIIVASALQALGNGWSPGVERILRDSSHFICDPQLQGIALNLVQCRDNGVPEEFGPHDFLRVYPQWSGLATSLSGMDLPMSVAEMEAAPLIEAATGRETARQLQDVVSKLVAHPEKAHQITAFAAKALQEASDRANPRPGLSHRSPDEILALPEDPSENLLGERLLTRGGKLVIAGAGGTGKSRLGLQLAASVVSQRPFITFPTNGHNLKWLILQGENDNTRLKCDLNGIKRWLGPAWPAFQSNVVLHTLETELDAWLSVEDDSATSAIRRLLAHVKPDVVVLDALYTFGAGDLNKDADMRATLTLTQQLIHRGNPKRAIVVIHHAATGKAGLAKMTGHDRASFGRNSKVLHSWTRGQINVAPLDPENNDLLGFSCGKASNGREFLPFAARLTEDMIYEHDESIDVNDKIVEASGDSTCRITTEEVADFCPGEGISKTKLVKIIREQSGVGKSMAYKVIDKAMDQKLIRQHTVTKIIQDIRLMP